VPVQSGGDAYIEPGSPWQNAYVESFGGRIHDELLAVELFSCLTEARVPIEDWRQVQPLPASQRAGQCPPPSSGWGGGPPTKRPRPPALTAGGPMNGLRSGDLD
jgi:hypothetical protein